jgi:mono/diheme cytochrome c family protein
MRCPLVFILAAGLALPSGASERSPQVLYMLNCQGCHLPDGRGMDGKVPDMRGMLGKFQTVEGGRQFIVRVPGTANSKLDDNDVARLLNWLVPAMGPREDGFRPYDAGEVHELRSNRLTDVAGMRSRLVAEIDKRGK